MISRKGWTESWPVVFCAICLVSFPLFFDIYRLVAFKTAPGDDYVPFLLLFISHQGRWPGSPFGYRVLSVIPAIPLYWFLPFYKFSLLPKMDFAYLKATEALSFLSFLATAGAATVAFKMVRGKLDRSFAEASLAALLTLVLANFDGIEGVDPIGVFLVFLLLYWFERRELFFLLFMLAPLANEKVILFFLFLIAGRMIFINGFWRSHVWQIGAVAGGLAIYILAIKIIALPGNEGQTEFSRRLPLLLQGSELSVSSLKGLVQDVVPVLVFGAPCLWFCLSRAEANGLMTASDLIVPLGMLFVGLSFTEPIQFQAGRIVAYAMPLTVIALLTSIHQIDEKSRPEYSVLVNHTHSAASITGSGERFRSSASRNYATNMR